MHRHGRHVPGCFRQVIAMQRRCPGVEQRTAVRLVHCGDQIMERLVSGSNVVMVLNTDSHAKVCSPARCLAQALNNQAPLPAEIRSRMLVTGENPDQFAAQIVCQPRELHDVLYLYLAMGYVGVLQIRGQITVARDADLPKFVLVEVGTERAALPMPVVEHRHMRTLRHQHDAIEAQFSGFLDEVVDRQERLPPQARIADRVQKKTAHVVLSDDGFNDVTAKIG